LPRPGLPKLQLQMTVLDSLDTKVDEIYFATCIKKATALMNCPKNIEGITEKIKALFQVPVKLGTHDY